MFTLLEIAYTRHMGALIEVPKLAKSGSSPSLTKKESGYFKNNKLKVLDSKMASFTPWTAIMLPCQMFKVVVTTLIVMAQCPTVSFLVRCVPWCKSGFDVLRVLCNLRN